jgi:uncharacterized membrane protein YhhN
MLPFPGGIGATANGLFVFSVVAAILFLFTLRSAPSLKRAIIKTIGILFLAAIASDQGAPLPLVLALLFASFGDFLLAFDGDRNFQLGLGGFLLAQVALVVLFLSNGSTKALWLIEPWRIVLALLILAHSVRLATILWRKLPRAMGGQIVGYALVITMMGVAALGYATPAVVAGVMLFILSDTLIAYERFMLDVEINQHPWISPTIWVTYFAAQLTILLGTLSAIAGSAVSITA